MSNIPYISIKSVLYNLSEIVPKQNWNESLFLEWANQGLRRITTHSKYEDTAQLIAVSEHTASLPSDLRYITQLAYHTQSSAQDIEGLLHTMNLDSVKWSPAINHMANPTGLAERAIETSNSMKVVWRPMRASTNAFLNTLLCDPNMFPTIHTFLNCADCEHEYIVNPNMTITTTLKEGLVYVSYLRFPKDNSTGDVLMPDNEELKEAIMHYCLWKYFLRKSLIGEDKSGNERDYHKSMFGLMKAKAQASIATPDVAQMENLKSMRDRLVPRDNQFDSFFSGLKNREKLTY